MVDNGVLANRVPGLVANQLGKAGMGDKQMNHHRRCLSTGCMIVCLSVISQKPLIWLALQQINVYAYMTDVSGHRSSADVKLMRSRNGLEANYEGMLSLARLLPSMTISAATGYHQHIPKTMTNNATLYVDLQLQWQGYVCDLAKCGRDVGRMLSLEELGQLETWEYCAEMHSTKARHHRAGMSS